MYITDLNVLLFLFPNKLFMYILYIISGIYFNDGCFIVLYVFLTCSFKVDNYFLVTVSVYCTNHFMVEYK